MNFFREWFTVNCLLLLLGYLRMAGLMAMLVLVTSHAIKLCIQHTLLEYLITSLNISKLYM